MSLLLSAVETSTQGLIPGIEDPLEKETATTLAGYGPQVDQQGARLI